MGRKRKSADERRTSIFLYLNWETVHWIEEDEKQRKEELQRLIEEYVKEKITVD